MTLESRIPPPLISPEIDTPLLFEQAQDAFSGDFEVRRLVAASPERALFVVRDNVLRREVALRVHLQRDTTGRRWFRRETELLASLHHRGLRTIYSAGFRNEWAYRVAKWVEGESLAAAVQRGPRPIPRVLRITRTLTSLLEYVHSNQIVVRRILPSTVMLETTGRTVVIDLRYASWCIDVADPWDDESKPFVAPEIRDGSIGDPRSDLYTVGAIIYNALTGMVPDLDPSAIVPPSKIRPASPRIFDRLLMRTLDGDPANRYFSADEMNDDLLSELGEAGVQIPVSPLRSSATDDTTAFEKHLRRALGDDYELLGELGSGGFGRVYQVRDLELEREVALKVLHPFLTSDPAVVERFRREAQLAARVVQSYIVNTYDIGGRLGLLWYTMEFVPGGNLGQVVDRNGPLPLDKVIRMLLESLEALKHAHSYGMVHRDLKPENILIHETGSVRIADFGLALALQRPDGYSGASSHSGTPEFAAPEQLLGEHVDLRADLYSLTLCAYFALTGSSPFGGGTPASILARHTIGSLPDLKSARSDLNDEFIRVLKKGAARDPADRFESAAAFEQAVIESQRRGWLNRFRRWWGSLGHRGLE
jgi:serine/threonine protein kinase